MSILVNKHTRVITQGITGKAGQLHTRMCREYAYGRDCFVAGVHPHKGGQDFEGIPVYGTVREAKEKTGATVSVIYVPPPAAVDAIEEAIDADLELIVCVTEGIAAQDMARAMDKLKGRRTILLGPNCPGIITPGEIKIGIMPGHIHRKGHIGVVSRTGTLTYEVVGQLAQHGFGQSTCVGIGRDPIGGLTHLDAMEMFNDDPDTDAVVMVGEVDGNAEEACAEWVKHHMKKPVIGFIINANCPASKAKADSKLAAMESCGIAVTRDLDRVGELVKEVVYEDSFWMLQ
jgi:succinyl-CoA synthetase alpha subunit